MENMEINKLLSKLAIGEVVVGTLSIVMAFVSVNWLDTPLIEAIAKADADLQDLVALPLFIFAVLIGVIVSLIGLIAGKTWAKSSFLWLTVCLYISIAIMGPMIMHGVSYAIDLVVTSIHGLIFGLIMLERFWPETLNKSLHQTEETAAE